MSKTQVLAYTNDNVSTEQFDLTADVGELGEVYLEVEKSEFEFTSGDAMFKTQDNAAEQSLYGLLQSSRKLGIRLVKNDDILFAGNLKIEGTNYDPDSLSRTFYGIQLTKAFIDKAAADVLTIPHMTVEEQLVAETTNSIPVRQILSGASLTTNMAGNLLDKKIGYQSYYADKEGKTKLGTIADFARDYGYTFRDFILDVCKVHGGAYWVDNDGAFHMQGRYDPVSYVDGLDDLIAGWKEDLRDPTYDIVLMRRGFYNVKYPTSTNIWAFLPDGWASAVDYPRFATFPPTMAEVEEGGTYTGAYLATKHLPRNSKYLELDYPANYQEGEPIFFGVTADNRSLQNDLTRCPGQEISVWATKLVLPSTELTVKFSELVKIPLFSALTARGGNYLVRKVLYDATEESTTVVGELMTDLPSYGSGS